MTSSLDGVVKRSNHVLSGEVEFGDVSDVLSEGLSRDGHAAEKRSKSTTVSVGEKEKGRRGEEERAAHLPSRREVLSRRYLMTAGTPPTLCRSLMVYFPEGERFPRKGVRLAMVWNSSILRSTPADRATEQTKRGISQQRCV